MRDQPSNADHDHPPHSRLLARLVRVLLAREPCETLPDLTEALKVECARLRIRWTNDAIGDAYRLIESNSPLPGAAIRSHRQPMGPIESCRVDDSQPLSRAEAAALWRTLCAALVRAQATGARHARP
jgi:hypothetical protein